MQLQVNVNNSKYTELAVDDLFSIFEIISNDKPIVAVEYIEN